MKTPSIKTRRFPTASKVVALLLATVILTPTALATDDYIDSYIGLGKTTTTFISGDGQTPPTGIPRFLTPPGNNYDSVTFEFMAATIIKSGADSNMFGISIDSGREFTVEEDVNIIFDNISYTDGYFQTYRTMGSIHVHGSTTATITNSELFQLNVAGHTQYTTNTNGQATILHLSEIVATVTNTSFANGLLVGTAQQAGTVTIGSITLIADELNIIGSVNGVSVSGYQKKWDADDYVTKQTIGAISLNIADSNIGLDVSLAAAITISATSNSTNPNFGGGSVLMTIDSGQISLTDSTVGSAYASGYAYYWSGYTDNKATINIVGDVSLSLDNTIVTTDGIYGGGVTYREDGPGFSITVGGNVLIDIKGTTDITGGIYAAGHGSGSTVEKNVTLSITGNDWNIAETNGGLTPNIIGKGTFAGDAVVKEKVILSLDDVQKEVNFERVRGFDVLNMNNGSLQTMQAYQIGQAGFTTINVDESSVLTVKTASTDATIINANVVVGNEQAATIATLATSARYGNDITVNSGSSLYAGNRVGNYIETGLISLEGGDSSLNLSDGSIVGFTIGGVSYYDTANKIITGGAQIATFTNQGQDNTYSHLFTENGINFEGATNVTLSILFDRSVFVGEIGTVLELGYDLISFGEGYTLTEDILGKFEFSIALNGGGAFHPNSGVGDLQAMYFDADGVSTTNFAEARGVRLAVTAYVPEPTTATLGILGLAGLLLRRRRRA